MAYRREACRDPGQVESLFRQHPCRNHKAMRQIVARAAVPALAGIGKEAHGINTLAGLLHRETAHHQRRNVRSPPCTVGITLRPGLERGHHRGRQLRRDRYGLKAWPRPTVNMLVDLPDHWRTPPAMSMAFASARQAPSPVASNNGVSGNSATAHSTRRASASAASSMAAGRLSPAQQLSTTPPSSTPPNSRAAPTPITSPHGRLGCKLSSITRSEEDTSE